MKIRTIVLLAIVALLLIGSAALRQAQGTALAQSSELPSGYVIKPGAASGGSYRLTSLTLRQAQDDTWQARGTTSGGGYRLAGPAGPTGTGTPCCCTYLPCVLRNYH